MKRIVIGVAVVALMFGLSVWALGWGQQMTGHLIVTCIDKETGGPITNATVTVKTLNCIGPNAGVYESHYTRTSAMTDSNGVADVEFEFLVPDFEWKISTPSHYSSAVGIPNECFDAEIVPSEYEDIDESTPEGAAMALKHLQSINDKTVGKTLVHCNLYGRIKTSDFNVQLQQFLHYTLK